MNSKEHRLAAEQFFSMSVAPENDPVFEEGGWVGEEGDKGFAFLNALCVDIKEMSSVSFGSSGEETKRVFLTFKMPTGEEVISRYSGKHVFVEGDQYDFSATIKKHGLHKKRNVRQTDVSRIKVQNEWPAES